MSREPATPRHTGGHGHYVEGERVFAPPSGYFDPDWVAGIVLDRDPSAGDRLDLARWALLARQAQVAGGDRAQAVAVAEDAGAGGAAAEAVVTACDDFVAAYGV